MPEIQGITWEQATTGLLFLIVAGLALFLVAWSRKDKTKTEYEMMVLKLAGDASNDSRKLNARVDDLQNELRQSIQDHHASRLDDQKTIADLRVEIALLKAREQDMIDKLTVAQTTAEENAELREQLKVVQSEIETLRGQVEQMEKDLREYRRERDEARKQVEELKEENKRLESERDNEKRRADELEARLIQLDGNYQSKESENE